MRHPPVERCSVHRLIAVAQTAVEDGQLGLENHLQAGHGPHHGLHRLVDGHQDLGGHIGHGHNLLDFLTLGIEDVGKGGLLQGYRFNDIGDGPRASGVAGGDYGHSHGEILSLFS